MPQELRLAGITTAEGANGFLRVQYIAKFNKSFKVAAAEKETAFRGTTRSDLDWVLTVQTERVVAKDNTVAIADRNWQIVKSRFRSSLAGCTVTIHEHLDVAVSMRYGPHVVGRYQADGTIAQKAAKKCGKGRGKAGPPPRLRLPSIPKRKHANHLRQAEEELRTKQPKPDRSCVHKSGQIDKLRTGKCIFHDLRNSLYP